MFVKVFRCCAVADDEDESNEAEDEKRCGEEMKKKALGHGERAAGPGAPRICGGTGAAAADAAPPAAGKIDAVAGCAEDHSSRVSSSSCATNTGRSSGRKPWRRGLRPVQNGLGFKTRKTASTQHQGSP